MTIYSEDHAPPPPKEPHLGRYDSLEFNEICKNHFNFMRDIYMYALLYFIVGISQWVWLIEFAEVRHFMNNYYHLALLTFYVSFMMLLALIFFHKTLTADNRKFFAYVFIMMQLGTIALILPIRFANPIDHIGSILLFVTMLSISLFQAFKRKEAYMHEPEFLMAWTIRYFVVSSMGIVVSTSLQNPYFDISLTSAIIFFVSIFIIVYGTSLNSIEFFIADKYGAKLYSILLFFSLVAMYSMGMWLIHEIVRAKELEI